MNYNQFIVVPLPLFEASSLTPAPEIGSAPKQQVEIYPGHPRWLGVSRERRHLCAPKTRSGYRGVLYNRNTPKNPWKAYINHNGSRVIIGYFPTKEEAAKAYNEVALKIHGTNTYLNHI